MPLNWQLWDRIRSFARQANIYRTENTFQDQSQIDRIIAGGNFIDFGRSSALLEQTNLQINRLERYKDYDMMDEVGEVSLALDLYADEASLIDPERKHCLIVRAKSIKIKRIIEDFLYNTLLIDREIRPMIRYLCKFGDFAAEIIPTKNRDGVSSFRFMNVYNFTRIQTKYGDLVGFYFQDPGSGAPVFMHPWQVMHMRLTSYESVYHPYGRCGNIYSPIWTPTGHKLLKDMQVGDEVYSFDEIAQKPVITKVLDKVLNGKKKTVIIKTKHRSIQITPEHPVLAIIKNNYINERIWASASERNKAHWIKHQKRDYKTKQYVLAQDLVCGDKLILPKLYNPGVDIPIEKYIIEKHAGKHLQIPDRVDTNFAKLMGFLIGDGWITNKNLYFAEGEYSEINRKYIEIIQSFGYEGEPIKGGGGESEYGWYKFLSVELSQTMVHMGLVGRCYEKRIPKWVFVAKDEIKKAFIEGLVDSDGSTNIDEWGCERFQIELTSEELVKDLKILLDQMNIKCGNISKRKRPTLTTVIHGEEYERRDSWLVYWYDAKMPSGDLLHMGKRRTKYDYSSDDYLVETILSIEDGGEIEVGDIQVSAHHNFIADGVVIHNSILDGGRKDFKRLRLMEDAALIYRVTRAPEKRIFSIPVGNIPPQQVPQYMELIARQMKKFKFVDPATGQINERYSPLIQEDDFWLPKRADGTGPSVDTLPGAENLDAIADIEYFKKKMVAALKIPFARVGIGEQEKNDGRSLASMSPEFAKAIQWIQREAALGIKKIIIAHLAMRGHTLEEIKGFDLAMTAASAIDELYRIETWNTRADIIANLKETGLFPDSWILERFTDMTREEIEEMEEERDAKASKKAADELVSVPEDKLSPEDKKVLMEYKEMEKRISTKRQDKINEGINTPVEWFVNQNEMVELTKGATDKGEVIFSPNLPESVINEMKQETLNLIQGSTEADKPIQDIAAAVEEVKATQPSMIVENVDPEVAIAAAVEEVKKDTEKDQKK